METVYILVILLSIFAHSLGISHCPHGPTADSAVFLIIAPMALHKLKLKAGLWEPRTWLGKIFEFGILCLLVQFVLVVMWFPLHQVVQNLADFVCTGHRTCQNNAATVVVLAIEIAALLKFFSLEDFHGIYGSKDELVTQSTLLILDKRQKNLERRERMMERKRHTM